MQEMKPLQGKPTIIIQAVVAASANLQAWISLIIEHHSIALSQCLPGYT